jgi:hypothetical protein
MRQIAYLTGFPLPGARLPGAGQRRTRRPSRKGDQLPAQRPAARQQQRVLMRLPLQCNDARRLPACIVDDPPGAVPACTTPADLRAWVDAVTVILPARLATHRRQPIPAVRG